MKSLKQLAIITTAFIMLTAAAAHAQKPPVQPAQRCPTGQTWVKTSYGGACFPDAAEPAPAALAQQVPAKFPLRIGCWGKCTPVAEKLVKEFYPYIEKSGGYRWIDDTDKATLWIVMVANQDGHEISFHLMAGPCHPSTPEHHSGCVYYQPMWGGGDLEAFLGHDAVVLDDRNSWVMVAGAHTVEDEIKLVVKRATLVIARDPWAWAGELQKMAAKPYVPDTLKPKVPDDPVTSGGGVGDGVAYRVGNGVTAPRALYTPDPEYTDDAHQKKYQGTVVLWLIVGPDGKPRDIRVTRPLGMGLDEKAIEGVSRWRFEPAMKGGRPVAVQINVEVNFRLY